MPDGLKSDNPLNIDRLINEKMTKGTVWFGRRTLSLKEQFLAI
ncbi:hypothetical protein [Sneathiella aquimaris]|nr:hypothetical protein [Sneathiella aquimaris]